VVVFDNRIPEQKHEEIKTAVEQGRMFLKKSMPGLSIYQLSSWSE
jgi:hypothetical protein